MTLTNTLSGAATVVEESPNLNGVSWNRFTLYGTTTVSTCKVVITELLRTLTIGERFGPMDNWPCGLYSNEFIDFLYDEMELGIRVAHFLDSENNTPDVHFFDLDR